MDTGHLKGMLHKKTNITQTNPLPGGGLQKRERQNINLRK